MQNSPETLAMTSLSNLPTQPYNLLKPTVGGSIDIVLTTGETYTLEVMDKISSQDGHGLKVIASSTKEHINKIIGTSCLVEPFKDGMLDIGNSFFIPTKAGFREQIGTVLEVRVHSSENSKRIKRNTSPNTRGFNFQTEY